MRTDPEQLRYLIGFSHVPGIGRVRLSFLRRQFGDLKKAWLAPLEDLLSAGLNEAAARTLVATRAGLSLEQEVAKLARLGITTLAPDDPLFPPRLRQIKACPILIYLKGTLLPEDELAVAVVGTRRPSAYGRQAAEDLSRELAAHRVTVVSGLATGIDAVAHRAALAAGGRTLAVAGCGLDIVYPPHHTSLANRIAEQGALISEFPPGVGPLREHFPRRNRIIGGMSLGVLVVEAGERSGALSTAHQAANEGREVFAVPGSIFSAMSAGTNHLIQDGAKLVRGYADIFEELKLTVAPSQLPLKEPAEPTDTEARVLMHLTREATHIDVLCRASGLPTPTVSSTLAMLEIKGLARQVGGMSYILN